MNARAAELGMTGTHFSNTHGYHDDDHYTTAYDIYRMCRQAMEFETFRTIVSAKNYTMPATNFHPEERIVRSTNALISNFRVAGYIYEYATGIKTGHTPEAGYCLAASATKDGHTLLSVVMGCEREPGTTGSEGFLYFDETTRLLEWGFRNFSRRTIPGRYRPGYRRGGGNAFRAGQLCGRAPRRLHCRLSAQRPGCGGFHPLLDAGRGKRRGSRGGGPGAGLHHRVP